MNQVQNRLQSPVFWTSIVSAIALVLRAFDIYQIDDPSIDAIVTVILSIVALFGIANNPTNKKGL